MSHMSRSLKMVLILALLTTVAAPVWAKKCPAYPVPVEVAPQWVLVPQAEGVQYAPNIQADLFSYGSNYYYLCNQQWYMGPAVAGPWQLIQTPPPVFYQVAPTYFKSPPGWAKGKKKGWRGNPMPPGQMKKYYQ